MRRTILLHVGPHKTGTTALQRFWQENRDHLARNGVLYPGQDDAHHALAHDLLGWKVRKFDRDKLLAACAEIECDTVILSSEDFSFLNTDQLRRLRNLLEGHEVRVVYFLRRIPDALYSFWQETIKQGRSATFAEVADGFPANQTSGQAFFDPVTQLRGITEVFGHNVLDVFSYDVIRGSRTDILGAFSQRYLTGELPHAGLKKKNAAPSLAKIELARQINQRRTGRDWGWDSHGFRQLLKRMDRDPIPWFEDFKASVIEQAVPYRFDEQALDPVREEVKALVGDRFVCDADDALSRYGSPTDRKHLYVPAKAPLNKTFRKRLDRLAAS
ncbi:hypothetical protein [Falsirhodobacter sp. 20TX0035]|uniref:hypothetical protein n=1 Tax=Falsirhodobacter sp. 20TX0035 TaxID=3022019 RepID=UPI00232B8D4E|nr:hypothetical protein [Falsirhodobacter sp. 20TX0035]MDB6455123.1 hypothetical protein [Falsirhodobacter sp. 20TX0035]